MGVAIHGLLGSFFGRITPRYCYGGFLYGNVGGSINRTGPWRGRIIRIPITINGTLKTNTECPFWPLEYTHSFTTIWTHNHVYSNERWNAPSPLFLSSSKSVLSNHYDKLPYCREGNGCNRGYDQRFHFLSLTSESVARRERGVQSEAN